MDNNQDSQQKEVEVNQNVCIGCGLCVSLCPNVFKLDEVSYKSEVIGKCESTMSEGDKSTVSEASCQNAIDSCPVAAISWKH